MLRKELLGHLVVLVPFGKVLVQADRGCYTVGKGKGMVDRGLGIPGIEGEEPGSSDTLVGVGRLGMTVQRRMNYMRLRIRSFCKSF